MLPASERNLHRYELVERIAVGGMAEVFRAKAFGAHGFEKNLAIKRILPELAEDPEFVERFISEAKLAVALSHANIVQVMDFGRVGGTLFIAMEYVDGPDLAHLLRAHEERGRRVPLAAALQIAMELAEGLAYAHRRGVIHRDISPSNILLSRAGETKLTDFGVAVAAAHGHAVTRIMGKWRYMSPEQARGQPLDGRSDLFSAAVVIHELLSGHRLFPGENVDSVVRNLGEMPIPPVSSLREGVPAPLDELLASALAREPARRMAGAEELLRGLREVSFAHGLVATALDVAEAVAWACPARLADGSHTGVDGVIRSELGLGRSVPTRVTERAPPPPYVDDAATRVTFVSRGEAEDGITRWEVVPAPAPAARRRSWRWLVPALALAGAAAGGLLWLGRPPLPPAPAPAPVVTPAPREAQLRVESTPPGATILVDGEAWPAATPATVQVSPSRPHRLEVSLAGHRPFTDPAVVVEPGDRVVYRPALERRLAHLVVSSVPPDAEVTLDDRLLGHTPLSQDVPADGAGHAVRLRRKGTLDAVAAVILADGAQVKVNRALEPAVRLGEINLYVEPWAEIWQGGKKLGEAPVSGLRLPVGRQHLRLVNPVQGRETTLTVEVPAKGVASYRANLPQ